MPTRIIGTNVRVTIGGVESHWGAIALDFTPDEPADLLFEGSIVDVTVYFDHAGLQCRLVRGDRLPWAAASEMGVAPSAGAYEWAGSVKPDNRHWISAGSYYPLAIAQLKTQKLAERLAVINAVS